MKYLVVSDNHGDRDVLVKIAAAFRDQVDYLFHCGDSELEADDGLWDDFIVVKGNCDYVPGYENYQFVDTGMDTVLVTHGHLYNVRFGLTQLALLAETKQANLVLFGHTHELGCQMAEGTLFLNPGSIRQPRGRYTVKTFAIIESSAAEFQVTYYDQNLQKVPNLHFQFPKG